MAWDRVCVQNRNTESTNSKVIIGESLCKDAIPVLLFNKGSSTVVASPQDGLQWYLCSGIYTLLLIPPILNGVDLYRKLDIVEMTEYNFSV